LHCYYIVYLATMKFIVSIFLILIFVQSCAKKNKKDIVEDSINTTIKQTIENNKRTKVITLNRNSKKEVKNWKEYQLVSDILAKYVSMSNEEALSNAKELSELVKHLKDSLSDKRLESTPLKARINILQNECLRLNDMSNIPSITPKEISDKVDNILESYSAFNAKLNIVFSVRNMENELELDPDFQSILNDSTHTPTTEKIKPPLVSKRNKKRKTMNPIIRKDIQKLKKKQILKQN